MERVVVRCFGAFSLVALLSTASAASFERPSSVQDARAPATSLFAQSSPAGQTKPRMDAQTTCTNAAVFAFERLETWIAVGIEQAALTKNMGAINKSRLDAGSMQITQKIKAQAAQWQDSERLVKVWGGMTIAIDQDAINWTAKYRNSGSNPMLWKQDVHSICMRFLQSQK